MAGISLVEAGKGIIYQSVPWAHNITSLKRASFPKGSVPDHLVPYLFKKGGIPATCASETANLSGASRVRAMNACVSAKKKR